MRNAFEVQRPTRLLVVMGVLELPEHRVAHRTLGIAHARLGQALACNRVRTAAASQSTRSFPQKRSPSTTQVGTPGHASRSNAASAASNVCFVSRARAQRSSVSG